MSGLDSWEDDPSVQEDDLSRKTQQNLHISQQNGQGIQFSPNANTFQPGAQSFTPGQPYQQYGQYNQSQRQPQYYDQQQQYGEYPQYSQQQGYQGYTQGYAQPPNSYNQGIKQKGAYQQPTQQRQAPVTIAKRPTATDGSNPLPSISTPASVPKPGEMKTKDPPVVKTLSFGAGTAAPKTKVMSISANTPGATSKDSVPAPEDGAKFTAAKAIEKTEKSSVPNGKTSPSPSSGKNSPTAGEAKAIREADAVAKEQAVDVDEEILEEVYGKEHVNVIFIGHVDAGKSTLGGSILYATGMVDERTMDKYKREAKEAGKESWYLSWVMDLNKEERAKGKTV